MPKMSEAEMQRAIHSFSKFGLKDNGELYLPILDFLAGYANSICTDEPDITHRVCAIIGFAVERMWGIQEARDDWEQEEQP